VDLGEHRRVQSAFEGYRADESKQRAWSAGDPGNLAIRDEVATAAVRELEHAPAGDVLDVGCGTGWWLRHLAAHGRPAASLHGIDIQPERIALAQRSLPGARLAVGDARELPFGDGTFAAATMLLLLSSLGDREAMARAEAEALRVLVPGGLLIIWDVRLANPRNRATVTPRWRRLAAAAAEPRMRPITLHPWLARRLGRRAPRLYPALARVPGLRTHRLLVLRRP
jgi:ubiquinone/menaquinone biosynthesis C-methylase UbiE